METGSPTSSAFSIPWLVVLIAGLGAMLAPLILHHCNRPDPALKAISERNAAAGSGASQSKASQPDEDRDRMARDSRKLSDEEIAVFLRGTILEKVEIVDKSLEEALAILRKEVRKTVPNGPVAEFGLSAKWPGNPEVRIAELKLHDVPLGIAIKYVCNAARSQYRTEDGSVILEAWHWMDQEEEDHFMKDSKIQKLEISDASISEAIKILAQSVREMDFNGRRMIVMPQFMNDGKPFLHLNESVRVQNFKLENVSVLEALQEFCKRTNTYYSIEEEQIFIQSISLFPTK